ncbi:MAG: 4Fe-4S binding protein [Coriobacteriia bacterium]|nr:4Fe-4S binding protein [Coriobacteriia bacterium]
MAMERTDRAARERSRIVRWAILGAVLLGMTVITIAHQRTNVGKPPGVDALCPFGGLETLFTFITTGSFIKRTAASALVLFVGTIGMALVYRRSFCGQLCPLGALQGIFGAIGGKLFKRRLAIPSVLDRPGRYLKYVVLAVFTVWTWQAAELVMRPYDPWAAYAHLTSPELMLEFGIGTAVLVVSLVGSLVYERFFCKYLCPTGAMLGLLSKVSIFRIKRDADACIDCGACDQACPMNIAVATADEVRSSECISCNECVNSCPAAGALEVKAPSGRSMSPLALTVIVVALLFSLVGVATAAGQFQWRMPTLGEAIEQHGGAKGFGESTDAAPGGFDTTLIKGYMSIAEISEATGIPAAEFTATFGVPAEALSQPMKDIKDTYGFSPEDVRAWVDERLAAP